MSGNCGSCGEKLEDMKNVIKCTGSCGNLFHDSCSRIKRGAKKDKWVCDACKDNSSASSMSSVSCTPLTQDFWIKTLDAFKQEVFAEMKNHNNQTAELRKSVEFLSAAVDATNKLMEEWKVEMKKMVKDTEELKRAREEDKEHIKKLQIKVRQLEQYSRRENIEIAGVPETAKEDVMAVVNDIGAALGVTLDRNVVVAAHRVPTFTKNRTPSIVVRFQTRDQRDTWINSYRMKRTSVTAKDINAAFPAKKIFVSEHLSPDLKIMLAKTKEICKNKGFAYVWVKEGKIFVRKCEGDKCHRIDDLDDLDKIK